MFKEVKDLFLAVSWVELGVWGESAFGNTAEFGRPGAIGNVGVITLAASSTAGVEGTTGWDSTGVGVASTGCGDAPVGDWITGWVDWTGLDGGMHPQLALHEGSSSTPTHPSIQTLFQVHAHEW